jgi:hypothetical protein
MLLSTFLAIHKTGVNVIINIFGDFRRKNGVFIEKQCCDHLFA